MLIIKTIGVEDVKIERARRIGSTDRGEDKRPRFISIEFNWWSERNRVKQAGEKLKEHPEAKKYYFKADVSKHERDEFKRLVKLKERIEKDDPQKKVEIKYGKLFVNETQIDKIKHAHEDF